MVKRTKSPRSRSSSRAGTLLKSSSPARSTSSKRRTVCGEKNGKLQCSVVDARSMPKSDMAKKHEERKKKNCQKQADLGLGVCDEDGDMHYYEEESPVVHEEIDKDGNIIRMMLMEPKKVMILEDDDVTTLAAIRSYFNMTPEQQTENFIDFENNSKKLLGAEIRNTNPDKLKQAFLVTPEEIKRRNTFRKYLACLVNDDVTSEMSGPFGTSLGVNMAAFSKMMLMNGLLENVFKIIGNQENRTVGREEARKVLAVRLGNFTFPLEDSMYFKYAVWQYKPTESVKITLPEALSNALAEKLLLAELQNAIAVKDSPVNIKAWIKRLAVNGSIIGSELSNNLIAMLLLRGGLEPEDLNLEDSYCTSILANASERRSLLVGRVGDRWRLQQRFGSGRKQPDTLLLPRSVVERANALPPDAPDRANIIRDAEALPNDATQEQIRPINERINRSSNPMPTNV